MVHYQRYCYQQLRKGGSFVNLMGYNNNNNQEEEEDDYYYYNNISYSKGFTFKPQLMQFIFLSLLCFALIWAPHLLGFSLFGSLGAENEQISPTLTPCSSMSNGTICCDRTSKRTDICYMNGDIRTHPISSSIFLYNQNEDEVERKQNFQREKIKPYTRKWETGVMNTIDELTLISNSKKSHHNCDVSHDIPAVFFSTGGYTGNLYHEFNDGIIPLYITSQHFNKEVVFVILEFHIWWLTKYGDILSQLTNYPPVIFNDDLRSHCFPQAIVGMNIHDELTIDESQMHGEKTIRDFRRLLDRAYLPRINVLIQDEERERQFRIQKFVHKPKLVILSRNGSRAIINEDMLAKVAQRIGFSVEVVNPSPTTELAKIYRALNSSDVMVGVHGAAMTHFMFLNPGCVFIQVVPLGTDWAAQTYYGEPAVKLGLKYIGYKITPRESSLYNDYDRNDLVLTDPERVNEKGWEYTKRIYLDKQNVRLDLKRFSRRLIRAYDYLVDKTSEVSSIQAQR